MALRRPSLSYAQLCSHIESVVDTLNRVGVGRNDRVAIVLPHGPELSTACLAIIAGAVAAPLNPELKATECESFLADLKPKLLLTGEGQLSVARTAAQAMGIPILELSVGDGVATGLFDLSTDMEPSPVRCGGLAEADDAALLLHTSGTTAKPRTVLLTQRNLRASADNLSTSLQLSENDCCLHLMPLFHIGGLIDVLAAPLTVGGSVVCTSGFSAPEFFNCLEFFRPTWTQAVPTMIQEILKCANDHRDIVCNNSLRLMRSVSAPLPIPVMEEFERVFNIPVIEMYGMTETAGLIASNPLPDAIRKPGSVGLPAGQEVAVVDEHGSPLPAMKVGEFVVRGNNVMAGYENDPNANTFFQLGFRTGDRGYLDADGYLFLTGRIKEIINRGGEKISPSEVDDVLQSHPSVAEAATFAMPSELLGEDVAAAVVLVQGATLSKQDLIKFLGPRLAYFKVPRTIHFVDEIPKTRGGKLQRTKLAQTLGVIEKHAEKKKLSYTAAQSVAGKIFSEMWSRLLKVKKVGIDDDFFDLGGDSLKAASFINELHHKWGETVYVSALFDAPSIAEFEKYMEIHHPELIAKILGQTVNPGDRYSEGKVDPAKVSAFRNSIARVAGTGGAPSPKKNRPAIFILSPPRSGSTLLRAILGGNDKLFAPPELYLLSFDNLADRKAWFSGSQRFQLEGYVRSIMQARNDSLEQAQGLVESFEQQPLSTQDCFRHMQEWIGDRILVDKTPFYASHMETLHRAEEYFHDPIYIHLLRHPYGMIRSFEEAKLEQLWFPRMVGTDVARNAPCPYQRRELAEMIWMILHENILSFLEGIPQQRKYRLKFEDLVGNPRDTVGNLCQFLDIDLHKAMLNPHQNTQKRMTDGIHPESRMIGDMKFHQHKKIDSDAADLWKHHYQTDFLSDETWRIAATLGYDQTIAKSQGRTEFEI